LRHNFAKFSKISQISLKYANVNIILSKIIEILRNSEKNPRIFDEKMQNLRPPLKTSKIWVNFCKKWCKGLKNHRNLEWCKGKNVELEKC
jgi:hypothetical protein